MAPSPKFGQPGAIVQICLRNFMTYNDITLKPGPNLNMVIGPNGSGKSAIVCAIIVGLAGDVSLTGRANSIADLVQRGCKWGSTEIELYNDRGRNWIVQRKMMLNHSDGKLEVKNEWRLNGVTVIMRNIKELMTSLNIKVDNLCQFLPQDSVASFVKMGTSELLVETLNAAGCHQLVEDLKKLVELTSEINIKTQQLTNLKKSSNEHEVNARRLETEVEELRAREELIKKKNICQLKIYYAKYTETLTKCDVAKDNLKDKEEALRQAESEGAPFQEKEAHYKAEADRLMQLLFDSRESHKRVEHFVNHFKQILEAKNVQCSEKYKDFKTKKDSEKQRDQQIRLKQQELESCECRLTEIREVDYSRELQAIKTEMERVRDEMIASKRNRDSVNNNQREIIAQIQEVDFKQRELMKIKEHKINFLSNKKRDAARVCEWLSKNLNNFQQHIFLPMMVEMNVRSQRDSPIIENLMNESDLYSFVCQSDRDLRKLTEITRRELRARINVIMPPEKRLEEFEPPRMDYSRLSGFRCYIKDMFDAPEPIMRYLYAHYQINRIPVFTDLSEADMKRVMDSGCQRFYVKEKCFQINKSRYDGALTNTSSMVNARPRCLIHSLDKAQLDQFANQLRTLKAKKETLDKQVEKLNEDIGSNEVAFREFQKRQQELSQKQGEKTRIETLIQVLHEQIDQLKTTIIDLNAEEAKFRDVIKNLHKGMIEELDKFGRSIENFAQIRKDVCLNTMKCKLAKKYSRLARKNYEETMKKSRELKEKILADKQQVREFEAALEAVKKIAVEKIKGFKNDKLDKATKQKFATIEEDTVEGLECLYEGLKARVRVMDTGAGNQILDEFERQNRELLDKRRQITVLEADLRKNSEDMEAVKTKFLPDLEDVLNVIDEHYRQFMRKLNYDGRVVLGRDTNNLNDFSKYGIDIMVKYRDEEELIPLSGTRQSGGERSVATMIYMLALQTKTTVPFRVVDEINQGMDKDNERKVFELLVSVADESSSQYFLVSPKLLSGLDYGEQMRIHIVYNGPQLKYSFDELMAANGDEAYESDANTDVSDDGSEVYYDSQQ